MKSKAKKHTEKAKHSDFKSAFYISLAIFSVAAIIVGLIIVDVVRF